MKRLRQSGHRYREVTIRNIAVYVDVTDPRGRYPFFYARPYEKAVTDAILTALKPADVFIDVGANIGYFSSLAAKRVGEPRAGDRVRAARRRARGRCARASNATPSATSSRSCRWRWRSARRTSPSIPPTTTALTRRWTRSCRRCANVATFRPATVVHATTLDDWLGARPELAGAGAVHQDRRRGSGVAGRGRA